MAKQPTNKERLVAVEIYTKLANEKADRLADELKEGRLESNTKFDKIETAINNVHLSLDDHRNEVRDRHDFQNGNGKRTKRETFNAGALVTAATTGVLVALWQILIQTGNL